jgi:membrane-bound lytic murein transglycosylase B
VRAKDPGREPLRDTAKRASLKMAAGAFAGLFLPRGAVAKQTQPSFDQWIAAFQAKAVARGITPETYARVMSGLKPDNTGLAAIHEQPEFNEQLWQYLNRRVSDWRIIAGRQKAQEYAALLARIERDYGVAPSIMLGVWGVESTFGDPLVQKNHMRPVIPSLATLAWGEPRRRAYWEGELINALTIIQNGWSTPAEMNGSWAGAMGHTQWMPEVWLHLGVDYDGDGKISPFGRPDDALATTARYFVDRGNYRRAEPWGYEVRAPDKVAGKKSRRHRQAMGAGAGRTGFPAWAEFLRCAHLQSVDELHAGDRASRRPVHRRRGLRAELPRQRARADARGSAGNSAPPDRARLRYRRCRRPGRQRHHACRP